MAEYAWFSLHATVKIACCWKNSPTKYRNKFATGVENKATGYSKRNDSPETSTQDIKTNNNNNNNTKNSINSALF